MGTVLPRTQRYTDNEYEMGGDPKTSVLNKFNQSHDVKNLFVMDGNSFVSGGPRNPTLTILALAMRASEYLADQLKKGNL